MFSSFRQVSCQQVVDWLTTGQATLIDVREPEEFASSHIPQALSLPLSSLSTSLSFLSPQKDKKIIFYCQSGMRSEQACSIASELFPESTEIYNLSGGIASWRNTQLPVVSASHSPSSLPPIFRIVQIIVGSMILFFLSLGFLGFSFGFWIVIIIGIMLLFSGLTGWCGLALLLSRLSAQSGKRKV